MILVLARLKIINFFLAFLKNITLKLLYLKAKYEIDDYSTRNQSIDLRSLPNRIKNILLYDENIINRRWEECQKCEYLIKPTNQCKKCKCFMKVKTRVASASCPIGKWNKEHNFLGEPNGITATT